MTAAKAALSAPHVPAADHPDDWKPGLHYSVKTLTTRSVSRATSPEDVVRVVLRHNLRRNNEDHRHRSRIDASRTGDNMVLVGDPDPEQAADDAFRHMASLGLSYPSRRDAVAAFEVVVQAPDGGDAGAFWTVTMDWLRANFEAIVLAVVHLDQRRPHLHVIALPILAGRMAGADMQRGEYGFPRQRTRFMGHIRRVLGLRPDRKVKTLADYAVSPGRGPKTAAAAARRDKALELCTASGLLGMEVDGHGGRAFVTPTSMPSTSKIAQPPAHFNAPPATPANRLFMPALVPACHPY